MKVYGVVGWKNSGKTGLVERLVAEITSRGFSVSTVKHAHHSFDVDHPGRDSYRHRDAGASEVMLSSGNRWALMHELREANEPDLKDLLSKMSPVDLILIEGYKSHGHAKIECHRAATGQPLIAPKDPMIRRVASDVMPDDAPVEVINLDDTTALADFVLADVGLK